MLAEMVDMLAETGYEARTLDGRALDKQELLLEEYENIQWQRKGL